MNFTASGDVNEGNAMFPAVGTERSGLAGACVVTSSYSGRFAIRWDGTDLDSTTNRTRIRRGAIPGGEELALVYDWSRGQTSLGPADEFNLRTTMYLEPGTIFTGPITIATGAGDSIQGGFAVRVAFPGFSSVATSRTPDGVIWQSNEDGSFTIFFRDALSSDTPIIVTPECQAT